MEQASCLTFNSKCHLHPPHTSCQFDFHDTFQRLTNLDRKWITHTDEMDLHEWILLVSQCLPKVCRNELMMAVNFTDINMHRSTFEMKPLTFRIRSKCQGVAMQVSSYIAGELIDIGTALNEQSAILFNDPCLQACTAPIISPEGSTKNKTETNDPSHKKGFRSGNNGKHIEKARLDN